MDFRKLVSDRMEELGVNVPDLAKRSKVRPSTLYDFVRNPKDMKGYSDGKKRLGNLNSEALAAVLVALEMEVIAKPLKKASKT